MHNPLRLLPYLRKYRISLGIALLGTACFTALSLLPPLLMRYLVDDVLRIGRWDRLKVTALAIMLVPVVAGGIRFFNERLLVQTSQRFIGQMRLALYERILNLSARYFGGKATGTIVGRVMDDINMLQQLLTSATVQIVVDVIVFVCAQIICFSISWKLSLILLCVIALYVVVYKTFSGRIRAATQAYRQEYDKITGRLQETLTGVRQVRIFNQEEKETEQFLEHMESGLEKSLQSSLSTTAMNISCTAITGIGSALILFVGAILVLHGQVTAGSLLAINAFVWMAIGPAMNLTNVAGELQETMVSIERILDILLQTVDVTSDPNAPRLGRKEGAVQFRNVRFAYANDTPLYRDLSLEVPAGTTVALVGPTGCGKTTLTSLLMRYWDVQAGAVLIDGVDIRSVNLKSLRDIFGVVLQTPLLFEGTLAENIAYGWPDAPRDAVIAAARAAEVYDVAMRLPQGLDTVIGTSGVKLSVGEKQRVSIARAIIKNPLILVMDEATSALDSQSEELIQKALANVLKNRTSFVIAHRLTTITHAGLIVVIDKGTIVEQGTHASLIGNPRGLYYSLYQELAGQLSRTTEGLETRP